MRPVAILLAALPALLIPSTALAEPRFTLSTPQIRPETEYRIVFDGPVIAPDEVGRAGVNSLLEIEPSWEGRIRWIDRSVAEFLPDAPPEFGVDYRISLRPGLRDAAGTLVPAIELYRGATEGLRLEDVSRPWRLNRGEMADRLPLFGLRFNGPVSPERALALYFEDAEKQRVGATGEHPTPAGLENAFYAGMSWENRFRVFAAQRDGREAPAVELQPDAAIPHCLMVKPVAPLPPGRNWRLIVPEGFVATDEDGRPSPQRAYSHDDVAPFTIANASAVTEADHPRLLVLRFSTPLPKQADWDWVKAHVGVAPMPPGGVTARVEGAQLLIEGDFAGSDSWTLDVKPGLVSANGLSMEKGGSYPVKFRHLLPTVVLPSGDDPQLAHGRRVYGVASANVSSLRVRVKRLSDDNAMRAFQGYRYYSGDGPDWESFRRQGLIPYSLVVGETVVDHTVAIDQAVDTSHRFEFPWDDLLPAESRFGILFVQVEGVAHPEAAEIHGDRIPVAQSVVQLTDVGLAWKLTGDEAALYVFSCETGQPLEGASIDVIGEDAAPLRSARTDGNGFARLERHGDDRHLRVRHGDDMVITAFDASLPTVSMWRFPVEAEWDYRETRRLVQLFTDRDLYRPGETVRLKGVVRRLDGNALSIEDPPPAARLRVTDPANRNILESDVALSDLGTFDHEFTVPGERTGGYTIQFEFPGELAAVEDTDDWRLRWRAEADARFTHGIYVSDFRRNAFEVSAGLEAPGIGDRTIGASIGAATFTGQALAGAAGRWYSSVRGVGFYPDRYRDFLFGDHVGGDRGYWAHYFGFSDDEMADPSRTVLNETGEATLDEGGSVRLNLTVPEPGFPGPQEVSFSAEVTDSNEQTLRGSASALVHGSEFYLGVGRIDRLVRVGETLEVGVLAVTPEGAPFAGDTAVEVSGVREVNTQVKMTSEDGRVSVRNETREEALPGGGLRVLAADHDGGGTRFAFTPDHAGLHRLTFRGIDGRGRPVATAVSFHVYGSAEFPWAYDDALRIRLVPEKPLYQPGETARLLVLSPIEGTALVTVERERVLRTFQVQLRSDEPVVEIPLEEADAPNAFVSVLVIKGSRDNRREVKEPILRLGYCRINVDPSHVRLAVELDAPAEPVRPAAGVAIAGRVVDPSGQPVSGAEVVLYAEDEGTLAVMGYRNPNPFEAFYAVRPLAVKAGASLDTFLPEEEGGLLYDNKGLFIGGGGDLAMDADDRVRRNFDPCAVWLPRLRTDADGRFAAAFEAPDTLTRYRIIAQAIDRADRFGTGVAAFTVSKPLMLEPGVPRFASEGDVLRPRATVRNTSTHSGTWRVSLATDEHAVVEGDGVQTIDLDPGESAVVPFAVRFIGTGTTTLTWAAVPARVDGAEPTPAQARDLGDQVESTFEVHYPVPLLRATRWVRLDSPDRMQDLLEGIDEELVTGRGRVELDFSRSRLLEAGSALDFLLQYPYGCLEQTTSSTLPWLTVTELRRVVPGFADKSDEQVAAALQAGVDRLLAMQVGSGGFGYWPADETASDWATPYAGIVLLKAREHGAAVPDAAVERLAAFLEESLRGIGEAERTPDDLQNAARSIYCLALAGRPVDAYASVLRDRIARLTPSARAMVALALHHTGRGVEAVAVLRDPAVPAALGDGYWTPYRTDDASLLLAWAVVAPDAPEPHQLLDRVLAARNPFGHWATTQVNGWTLLGLAAFAGNVEGRSGGGSELVLRSPAGEETFAVDAGQPTRRFSFALGDGLSLAARSSSPLFVRVAVAAKPEIAPSRPVAPRGIEIVRTYERVMPDGKAEPLGEPRLGDIVRVTLAVRLPERRWSYLVVEDPLPSAFEALDMRFTSQSAGPRVRETSDWRVAHRELRNDRALFFVNSVAGGGTYEVVYHARVTTAGSTFAPAAKVEEMYDPESFALSGAHPFTVADRP